MSLKSYASKRAILESEEIETYFKKNAKFQGDSRFTDYVLVPANMDDDIINTDKDLMWVRHIKENVWPTMKNQKFYPFHKANITWPSDFQVFEMPLGSPYIECETLKEAKAHFSMPLKQYYSFERTSKEYALGKLSFFIEKIKGVPTTIEVLCRDESSSLKQNMKIVDKFMKEHNLKKSLPHQVATLVRKTL